MQCVRVTKRDGETGRMHLRNEQLRLQTRVNLMEIAAPCRRTGADQREVLMTFQQCDWSLFHQEAVERYVSPEQKHVLESDPLPDLDADGNPQSRVFGIRTDPGTDSFWAPAVPLEEYPTSWKEYADMPENPPFVERTCGSCVPGLVPLVASIT